MNAEATPPSPHQSKLRVLIADDSAEIRQMLVRLCAFFPHVEIIGEAEDGRAALAAVRKLKPDVITLDIRMPKMSGIEVLKAARAEGHACVVIVLTGMADETYRQKCVELGANYFFEKAAEFEKVGDVFRTL